VKKPVLAVVTVSTPRRTSCTPCSCWKKFWHFRGGLAIIRDMWHIKETLFPRAKGLVFPSARCQKRVTPAFCVRCCLPARCWERVVPATSCIDFLAVPSLLRPRFPFHSSRAHALQSLALLHVLDTRCHTNKRCQGRVVPATSLLTPSLPLLLAIPLHRLAGVAPQQYTRPTGFAPPASCHEP
jgi:hypothetical protein